MGGSDFSFLFLHLPDLPPFSYTHPRMIPRNFPSFPPPGASILPPRRASVLSRLPLGLFFFPLRPSVLSGRFSPVRGRFPGPSVAKNSPGRCRISSSPPSGLSHGLFSPHSRYYGPPARSGATRHLFPLKSLPDSLPRCFPVAS